MGRRGRCGTLEVADEIHEVRSIMHARRRIIGLDDLKISEKEKLTRINVTLIHLFVFFVLFLLPPQKRMRVLEVISFVLATSFQLRGLLAAISRSQSRR